MGYRDNLWGPHFTHAICILSLVTADQEYRLTNDVDILPEAIRIFWIPFRIAHLICSNDEIQAVGAFLGFHVADKPSTTGITPNAPYVKSN